MIWLAAPFAALLGYLLGSVPVGVWVCLLYGVDIRTIGSGRTGATNAWRAAGLKAAIPTLLGDALKGAVAIWLVRILFRAIFPEPGVSSIEEATLRLNALHLAEALAGGAAIIGHNWSLFLGFSGGAGGITGAATTMMLDPFTGGIVWLVGILLFWWGRIASVATFSVGAVAFGVFLMKAIARIDTAPWPYVVYGLLSLLSVLVALRPNRQKLRDQQERVVTLW